MVVQANSVIGRVDKILPRVLLFELSITFLLFVDATVALFVRIRDFVFAHLVDVVDALLVDVCRPWRLHLKTLKHLGGAVK